eukprot:TRINITY_DN2857_c0_g1_i1.p5 TRINITY_DN2857_c0_g1~~TRINITY_DN2857_c0_g1_i1.p5  ORF type:complete len:134 (-),score=16.58 TRINITY_DN2857_c0_g1_i1:665-1066(-)
MEVLGTMYPIPVYKKTLAQVTQALQMGSMGVVFFGEQLRQFVGISEDMVPTWYQQMQQNKIGVAMGIWFVGNAVNDQLVSTGAFEVYYNGQLIFSKLDKGRLPNLAEIFDGIERVKHVQQGGQINMENQKIGQ